MSMQRSFLTLIAIFTLSLPQIASPIIFDELNAMFHEMWALDELAMQNNNGKNTQKPRYEKDIPQNKGNRPQNERPQQPPLQPQEPLPQEEKSIAQRDEDIRFNNIVGQDEAVALLRGVVEQFKHPHRLKFFGGEPKKGILLEGPPGTGKTTLAKAIANELGYSFHECSASSFVEVFVGTGAQRVRELFNAAHASAPAVIFVDEIDAAAGSRGEGTDGGSQEYRQTTLEFLTQMNKLTHESQILVVTATNCIEHVDEAFKAPHRFDVVTVGLPTTKGRADTLRYYLNKLRHVEVSSKAMEEIVEKTKGFSQSQIKSVVNGAIQLVVNDKKATKITDDYLLYSLEQARNAMRASIFGSKKKEYDSVTFQDIAGMDGVVQEFQFLVHSLQNPDQLKAFGVLPPKGILLEGRPGCGKTMLVRALANEAHCEVISVSGGSFTTRYAGDGAKELHRLFASAALVSPAIIFIDEVDAICMNPVLTNQLLTEMDGFVKENNVIVIGATNHLDAIDYRLRREGRFSRILSIPLPGEAERRKIFELYIKQLPKADLDSIDYNTLVFYTQDFSGAGIKDIVNTAALFACIENAPCVAGRHFQLALERSLAARKYRE